GGLDGLAGRAVLSAGDGIRRGRAGDRGGGGRTWDCGWWAVRGLSARTRGPPQNGTSLSPKVAEPPRRSSRDARDLLAAFVDQEDGAVRGHGDLVDGVSFADGAAIETVGPHSVFSEGDIDAVGLVQMRRDRLCAEASEAVFGRGYVEHRGDRGCGSSDEIGRASGRDGEEVGEGG